MKHCLSFLLYLCNELGEMPLHVLSCWYCPDYWIAPKQGSYNREKGRHFGSSPQILRSVSAFLFSSLVQNIMTKQNFISTSEHAILAGPQHLNQQHACPRTLLRMASFPSSDKDQWGVQHLQSFAKEDLMWPFNWLMGWNGTFGINMVYFFKIKLQCSLRFFKVKLTWSILSLGTWNWFIVTGLLLSFSKNNWGLLTRI